jgi:putative redox protein
MSVVMTGKYIGGKNIELLHEQSGAKIITDAPRDNGGEGAAFSPTDLVGAALGSCVLTTIALVAQRSGLNIDGMHMRVEKHMGTDPRRISELVLNVHLPQHLEIFDRQKLERGGLACPVHKSLHPEVIVRISFAYDV